MFVSIVDSFIKRPCLSGIKPMHTADVTLRVEND